MFAFFKFSKGDGKLTGIDLLNEIKCVLYPFLKWDEKWFIDFWSDTDTSDPAVVDVAEVVTLLPHLLHSAGN
jgi:hypothetical protein